MSGPLGVNAADLNGDGYLDLVVGSYNDPVSGHRDMGLMIFWGGPDGYSRRTPSGCRGSRRWAAASPTLTATASWTSSRRSTPAS